MLRAVFVIVAFASLLRANEPLAPIVPASEYHPASVYSAPTECYPLISECSECVAPGWWATADLLVWRAHMRSLDYAASEDGTSLAIGAGENHRVEFDRDAGLRTELGYMSKVGWGVSVGYTYFTTGGADTVTRPPGIGQLFSTISHPGGPEEADIASASTSLDLSLFELAARSRIVDGRFRSVDLIGGLRWANIDQELIAQYDGRDFVNGEIYDRMNVDAVGIFFGGETHWRLAGGWSIFGRGSLGMLYGRMENIRLETNLNEFEQLVDFRDEYIEPIFNFDARLGIGKQCGKVSFRTGYDLNLLTNVGDGFRFNDDIEESSFSVASGDLLLEGLFFQAGVNW